MDGGSPVVETLHRFRPNRVACGLCEESAWLFGMKPPYCSKYYAMFETNIAYIFNLRETLQCFDSGITLNSPTTSMLHPFSTMEQMFKHAKDTFMI